MMAELKPLPPSIRQLFARAVFLFSAECIPPLQISLTDISEAPETLTSTVFTPPLPEQKIKNIFQVPFIFLSIKSFRPNPGQKK